MDVQTVTVVIAGISVIIGVINSILSSRRAEKNDQLMLETRQAQLFAQVHNRWTQRDALKAYGVVRFKNQWTDRDDWIQKYGPAVNPEAYTDYMTLNAFFEGIGVFVKKGLIDIELVEDLFSQRLIWYWEHIHRDNIEYTRKITNDPTQYDSYEYLYNEMKKRQKQATVIT